MTGFVQYALVILNVTLLVYLVTLNIVYTILLVLGWTENERYVRRRRLADLADMRRSSLTTPISILVPAYDEEPVIADSVRALLDAAYPLHEVIVVNDGSRDGTLAELIRCFSLVEVTRVPRATLATNPVLAVYACPTDDRLVVIDKANGGKADAVNAALNYARYPLFCTVDSDTIIDDAALLRLVRPFQDEPKTVACGGVVRIVNGSTVHDGLVVDVRTPRGLLENIQIVEYFRGFLAGRTGWARIGGMLVISGAFGVFRREIVIDAGGYDRTTVGEDAELVVRLHRHCRDRGIPYRIATLQDPVCWTQAPSTLRVLARQRDRWHRGLIEVLWRHRSMIGRRRYGVVGLVALPYFLVFEAAGPVIEVAGYAATVAALLLGVIDTSFALALLILSLTYGLVLSFGALVIEERAFRRYRSRTCMARMVAAAFAENFGYRQWHSLIRARAFVTLARGAGWGDMTRRRFDGAVGDASPPPRRWRTVRPRLALVATGVALVAAGAMWQAGRSAHEHPAAASASPAPSGAGAIDGSYRLDLADVAGLRLPARATSTSLELATPHGFAARFWPGVNLGSTTPGHAPGELAIGRAEADRWLAEMGRLRVRVLRVYTILPPSFYDALRAYDLAHAAAPIYLIHGIWIPDEDFLAHRDLYRPSLVRAFRAEIADAVAVVHGDASIAAVPGHASGRYRSDVSPWLLAWSPGIEWDPRATAASDRSNAGRPAYTGRYITTRGRPTPTESWLASMLDYVASLEVARGWSRPLTFTNWLTTDPLHHPEERLRDEDRVGIDAMHLAATDRWPGGFFASYHAYPYYPDFLGLTRAYAAYRGPDGRLDPYAGYLHALRAHHRGQAVLVSEFGVPTGLGIAHRGPLGRDQGGHSEREAMAMDASMLHDIQAEGFAGGVVFEWADEWFKHTWNTMAYEQPEDRRALWRNTYTNEEHFGLLAQDAEAAPAVVLDGRPDPWATTGANRILAAADGLVRTVDVHTDEEYLTLRIETSRADALAHQQITVGFDVTPGANGGLPGLPGTMRSADVALELGPGPRARVSKAAWFDPFPKQYGDAGGRGYVHVDRAALQMGSGAWSFPRLMLNYPYRVRATGQLLPAESVDISHLPWGSGDPSATGGDTRNLVDGHGTTIEVRIPWLLLGYADPSSHLVLMPHPDGSLTTIKTGRVGIGVVAGGRLLVTSGASWADWDAVTAHERLKQGVGVLAHAFAATAGS